MLKDLRYAFRVLRRNSAFSAVAILSLAIGIGGAASVFTVLNAVVLRALPVPDPQQLHAVVKRSGTDENARYSWPVVEEARRAAAGKAEIFAATTAAGMQIRIAGRSDAAASERGTVQLVSGEFFDVLRQQPQAGRLLGPADNVSPGAHPVAVISDAFWTRRFDRAADVAGRQIVIGGSTLTVVGVAAPGFFGPFVQFRNPDVWVPLMMQQEIRYAFNASLSTGSEGRRPWPPQPSIEWLAVFARVTPEGNAAAAAAALTVVTQRDALSRLDAGDDEGRAAIEAERVMLEPASLGVSSVRDDLSSPLVVLLAMVGVLLALTCGNVASLLLARASARERELAIRVAIGAGRWRLIRQLLGETLVLSVIGGALGLIVAAWGRDVLLAMFSRGAAVVDLDTSFDWRVLGFTVGITAVSGLLVGLIPAVRGTRVAPTDALKAQARQVGVAGGRRGALVGKTLVTLQIAFCLLLLVVAGLFVRSMQSLLGTDVGYDRREILVARVDIRSLGLGPEARQALYARLLERIEAIPGVSSASLSLNGPMGGSQRSSSLAVEGYTPASGERLLTDEEVVTDAYFETVGLRILEGRGFLPEDRTAGRRSTIINQSMARRFFPSGGAIGRRWSYGNPPDAQSPIIVGVVEDAKYRDIRGAVPNMIYRLAAAYPEDVLSNLEVRTSMRPDRIAGTLRDTIVRAEPALPLFDVVPLDERMNRGLANDRLFATLAGAFGTVALLLAALGLYGTISYGVTRRVTELGVRMAVGASRGSVLWLVIREALMLVGAGALIGIPLAVGAGRAVASMLHGVAPVDAVAYAGGAALLLVVATIAAYIPAHRAARIDPMVALRGE